MSSNFRLFQVNNIKIHERKVLMLKYELRI